MNFEKLVPRCPTSSHRCIPIMTQRRALHTRILKMENYEKCWLHHCICKVEKTVNHHEYQLHRGNLLQCFHLEAKNRETNSRVLSSSTLTRQICGDPFVKAVNKDHLLSQAVKGMYPAPHIHEHFTIHKWLRQTAYILTHNLNMLEHTANNGMNTTKHTDANIAQF